MTLARVALVAAALLAACGDDSGRGRDRDDDVGNEPDAPRCGSESARGARVVVDVSQSMRGFARPGSSTLEDMHRAIDESLAFVGVSSPLERCELGETMRCGPARGYRELGTAAAYAAPNCRLDRALRRPPPGDDAASRDVLDHHRMVVLVTDGMQSSSGRARGADDVDSACLSGADPECIRALLRQRVREGYGVWLGLALLPFRGEHFAERSIDQADFERVREHLAEARRHRPYHETALAVLPRSLRATSYGYDGLRPLLVVALTCDTRLGQLFMEGLASRLDAAHVAARADERFAYAQLAPIDPQALAIKGVRAERRRGDITVARTRPRDGLLRQRVACDPEGRARLRLEVTRSTAEPLLPDYVHEAVSLDPLGRRLSRSALREPERVEGGDDFRAELRCLRLSEGRHRARFALRTRLSFAPAEVPTDTWWRKLSAPNTFEMPERAYALEELATGVLAVAAERRHTWGRLVLEVDRN